MKASGKPAGRLQRGDHFRGLSKVTPSGAPVPPIYALIALFATVSLPCNIVHFSAAVTKRKAGHSLLGLAATNLSLAQTAFVFEVLMRPMY